MQISKEKVTYPLEGTDCGKHFWSLFFGWSGLLVTELKHAPISADGVHPFTPHTITALPTRTKLWSQVREAIVPNLYTSLEFDPM